METAYEVILNNNERVMRDMYGNLNTHCLMYKDECIFDGELHSNSAVDFSNCTSLLDILTLLQVISLIMLVISIFIIDA